MELDKNLVKGSMGLLVMKLLESGDIYGYQMNAGNLLLATPVAYALWLLRWRGEGSRGLCLALSGFLPLLLLCVWNRDYSALLLRSAVGLPLLLWAVAQAWFSARPGVSRLC